MKMSRFVSNTIPESEQIKRNPVVDYEDLPALTLEDAVKNIILLSSDAMNHVATAKTKCIWRSTLLTQDESAAIYLYTMPGKVFSSGLNAALRDPNRQLLKPWYGFLKLLITALKKLPSTDATIWRGVNYDATSDFLENDVYAIWYICSCSMNINSVQSFLSAGGTLFAIDTIHGKNISMFSAIPDEQEVILMPGTRVRAKNQSFNFIDRLFIIHLEEINKQSNLLEQIKRKYQRNSHIKRFMNPTISYPIEQNYINLAIVKANDHHEKEKQLRDAQNAIAVMGTFEEIYGMKTGINVEDIFKTCKNDEKQVLVFGRAGIGKSTFCQYIAYKWATGSYWTDYELLALIPLRLLTADRYPPLPLGQSYSLMDLVKREVLQHDLSEKEQGILKKQFDSKKILWVLDGFDEIVQNVPSHLQYLLEQLLKTPNHILTSRPYLNTLSYDLQMEITGFTDENISSYVQKFFAQMKDEFDNASVKSEKLLNYLRSNSSIWGVAHIPINLELICSQWSNEDWSETEQLTMTKLYTMMTDWLFRRYLRIQDNKIPSPQQKMELTFLENVAFHAMKSNTIIIRPTLLQTALNEAHIFPEDHPDILNMGILKSFRKQGIGNRIEMEKDHYFVHLSFQEYFAARYLINALKKSETKNVIDFIKQEKYNQRYTLVFNFAAGLLSSDDAKPYSKIFWDCILEEPLDLVGIRNMQLVISCMEETTDKSTLARRYNLLEWIARCIKCSFTVEGNIIRKRLAQFLQRAQSVICDQTIINVLIDLLEDNTVQTKVKVLSFIAELKISDPPVALITSITTKLEDKNEQVRVYACLALGKIAETTATNELISRLVSPLKDQSDDLKIYACEALGKMDENVATNKVISKLVSALEDQRYDVRQSACSTLGILGETAATNEVISKLVSALEDQSCDVRQSACSTLGKMGAKAATNEVISKLVSALEDHSDYVRPYACKALGKLGAKAATNEVISKLVSALEDQSYDVRRSACSALKKIGAKGAITEVIRKLVNALQDKSDNVKLYACEALEKMDEKVVMNEMISRLISALENQSYNVRQYACLALAILGAKAVTTEMITKLVSALEDQSCDVRQSACYALGNLGAKAATNEAISKLISALENESTYVRKYACKALGKLGGKTATNEVINKLISALRDDSAYVRLYVCRALRKIGAKAATTEVISKLVNALRDENGYVRQYACSALGKMGEKAATNEVISEIIALRDSDSYLLPCAAAIAVANIFTSSAVIIQLDPKIIADVCLCFNASNCMKNILENDFFEIFSRTKNSDWLSAMTRFTLLKGSAVVAMKDKVVVYGTKQQSELVLPSSQLQHELITAFTSQRKRLHLDFEIQPEA